MSQFLVKGEGGFRPQAGFGFSKRDMRLKRAEGGGIPTEELSIPRAFGWNSIEQQYFATVRMLILMSLYTVRIATEYTLLVLYAVRTTVLLATENQLSCT